MVSEMHVREEVVSDSQGAGDGSGEPLPDRVFLGLKVLIMELSID